MTKGALIFDFDNTLAENIDVTDHDILEVIKGYKAIEDTSNILRAIRAAHSDFQICLGFLDGNSVHRAYEQIVQINMRKVVSALYKKEVINTIKLLSQKYPLFIVSGRDTRSLKFSIKNVGLEPFFQQIIGDMPYQQPKPDPEILISLFKKYALKSESCIYIGDTYTDFIFARNASCKFIGAGWYRKDNKLCVRDICKAPNLLEHKITIALTTQ